MSDYGTDDAIAVAIEERHAREDVAAMGCRLQRGGTHRYAVLDAAGRCIVQTDDVHDIVSMTRAVVGEGVAA